MIAKSKSATIFKVVLAFAMLVPCAFLFAACNSGDPIEQSEAMTALATTSNVATYTDVSSYTITQSMEQQSNEDGAEMITKQSSKAIVYKNDNNTIIDTSVNMEMTMKQDNGATVINSSATGSVNYKLAKIGDSYYKINEKNKVYDTSSALEMETTASILSILTSFTFIDDAAITAAGDNIEMDLRTTGENSYNLRFTVTETNTMQEGTEQEYVEKTVNEFYYEIRDSKITKYESTSTEYKDDAQVSKTSMKYAIEYSAKTLTAPTSLEGYTEADLSFTGIPGIFG